MKTFMMLLKRESWEHPALWIVPAVLAALIVIGMAYGLFMIWHTGVEVRDVGLELSKLAQIQASDRRDFISAGLVGMATPFGFFLAGLAFFYALDSLYADRRDRSILFWKSMPVSDVQTVMSKLAMVVIVAPLMTLAVVMVFHIVAMLFGTVVALWAGTEGWYMGWDPLAFIRAWLLLGWVAFAQMLIFLPLIAWLMLASAWAGKAPFLWATVPPVAVSILEMVAYEKSYLGQWLLSRVVDGWPLILADISGSHATITLENGGTVQMGGFITARFDLLWSGFFWQGLVVAVLFLAAAIWLRRYRADAE
jgi:ABC-2 type transport system permease protein